MRSQVALMMAERSKTSPGNRVSRLDPAESPGIPPADLVKVNACNLETMNDGSWSVEAYWWSIQ